MSGNANPSMLLGPLIAAARQERGSTQEALGDHLGISKSEVSKIESGKVRVALDDIPKFEQFLRLRRGHLLRAAGLVDDPRTVREWIEQDRLLTVRQRRIVLEVYDLAAGASANISRS